MNGLTAARVQYEWEKRGKDMLKNATAINDDTFIVEQLNSFFAKIKIADKSIDKDEIQRQLIDYYRAKFGNPDHLPNGPDTNKQITYEEYIERAKGVPSENIYNAFIMPFNRKDNIFFEMGADGNPIPRITDYIGNIGEAVCDWKPDPKNYERVQGIVIDTVSDVQLQMSISSFYFTFAYRMNTCFHTIRKCGAPE